MECNFYFVKTYYQSTHEGALNFLVFLRALLLLNLLSNSILLFGFEGTNIAKRKVIWEESDLNFILLRIGNQIDLYRGVNNQSKKRGID